MSQPIPGDQLPIPLKAAHHTNHPVSVPNMFGHNPFAVASPTAAPTGGHRSMPTLLELFHSFKRRWILGILIGGIVASVVAAAIWMVMPSGKHQVRAIVQMRASLFNGLVKEPGQDSSDNFDRFKENQLQTMKTRGFMARVGNDPAVRDLPMLAVADKASVYDKLIIPKFETPEMCHIKMNGDDKDQLQLLLAAFVRVYVAEAKTEERQAYTSQEALLIKSVADATIKIKNIEEKIRADHSKGSVSNDPAFQRQLLAQEINRLALEISRLDGEAIRLTSELQQVERELAGDIQPDAEALAVEIEYFPSVILKLAAVKKADAELTDLRKTFVAGNPRITEKETEINKLTAALEIERNAVRPQTIKLVQIKRRLELTANRKLTANTIEPIRLQLTQLKINKGKAESDLSNLGQGVLATAIGNTELLPTVEMRNKFLTQLGEIQNVLKSEQTRVSIKEDAVINENYNRDQKIIMSTGAAMVAMLGILLIISYLEWRNRRVDGVDQVVTELGMRVIGTIPAFPSRASLRSGEASQNQNWRFILNESVNSTRTMLLHAAKTQQMQIILVTSAMQGEGKTSLSSQLATSMATAGLRTLILDCDLRNPSMQKLFDIPVSPGCSEILLQEIDIADAVQPTSVPNLWIIPAGQCNHRVIAALAQGHPLEAMFNRLRGQFDIIIVDSCPILPVADTLLVAQHVDGVVFSILQDVSQLPKVQDASERMVHLNIPLLGAVVNGIKPDIQAYGYNYVKQLPA